MRPILLMLGQNPSTVALTQSYLNSLSYGLWALFIAITLHQFLLAIGHPKILNLFAASSTIMCVISFYTLALGHFGVKPMGIAGLGAGMSVAFITNLGLMLTYILCNSSTRHYFFAKHVW